MYHILVVVVLHNCDLDPDHILAGHIGLKKVESIDFLVEHRDCLDLARMDLGSHFVRKDYKSRSPVGFDCIPDTRN